MHNGPRTRCPRAGEARSYTSRPGRQTPACSADRGAQQRYRSRGTAQKFTEPVALLSTSPGNLRLAATAPWSRFVLLALRARCKGDSRPAGVGWQEAGEGASRKLHDFLFASPEWGFFQHAKVGTGRPERVRRERNSPSRRRFRPPSPVTFRFRVRPPGRVSSYSRSVLGALGNLGCRTWPFKASSCGKGCCLRPFSCPHLHGRAAGLWTAGAGEPPLAGLELQLDITPVIVRAKRQPAWRLERRLGEGAECKPIANEASRRRVPRTFRRPRVTPRRSRACSSGRLSKRTRARASRGRSRGARRP